MKYTLEFKPVWANLNMIYEGIWYTVLVSVAAIAIGITLGIVAASFKTSRIKVLSWNCYGLY